MNGILAALRGLRLSAHLSFDEDNDRNKCNATRTHQQPPKPRLHSLPPRLARHSCKYSRASFGPRKGPSEMLVEKGHCGSDPAQPPTRGVMDTQKPGECRVSNGSAVDVDPYDLPPALSCFSCALSEV